MNHQQDGAWACCSLHPPDASLTQAQVDAQPWYLIEIPRYTRGLVVLAIVCTVVISIFGAALMPTVLIVFGW